MTSNYITENVKLLHGDCLAVLKELPDNSVDSVVADPPYGLAFMGKKWDYDVPSVEVWRECLRVLKPGGHLLSFAGSRTYHRMTVAIEDAGFEIRDQIMWVYGCLDEQTEVATSDGVKPHHQTKVGDTVLCYNPDNGEYSYQPILEIVEYDYSDTAYRLVGDFGEQVVSHNHRCIVERDGSEAFMLAETLECEARVPILEDLPALQQAIHGAHAGAGCAKQDMRASVLGGADWGEKRRSRLIGGPQGPDDNVRGMFKDCLEAGRLAAQGDDTDMQPKVQWGATRCGVGKTCSQGKGALVGRIGGGIFAAHDGADEPSMEGRSNVSESEGCICEPADQVRSLPCGVPEHGAEGRVCNGAPSACGASDCATVDQNRGSASHQPQGDGQSAVEPDAVCHERAAQGVRAWRGHRSAVVRVVPFHYTGKVWCLRVPTGAFVAVRNGVAFPTGNSGFPKSLDVSKAIDKAAGSEAAHQWQGWGTSMKPSFEPLCFAQKPLTDATEQDTIAANLFILESKLWSLLFASAAETNSTSSQNELSAACAIAQWTVESAINTRAALSGAMGTLPFESATRTSLSIVSSWRRTLAENSNRGSTSITETKFGMTTDWKTLSFCLSAITPQSIIAGLTQQCGLTAFASNVERYFDAELKRLQGTLELSALAPAISSVRLDSMDVDEKVKNTPICVARKPLIGTVAANVLEYGTGGINVDGCRVGYEVLPSVTAGQAKIGTFERGVMVTPERVGRWPANFIHDGSDEVVAGFPVTGPSNVRRPTGEAIYGGNSLNSTVTTDTTVRGVSDNGGSAARFFKQIEVTDAEWLENLSPALIADSTLSLSKLADAIAQSDAAISALPEGRQLNVLKAPSTSVTPSESRLIATSVITAIQSIASASLLAQQPERLSLSHSHVSVVAHQTPTGIMMITASLSSSAGCAESITFSITPKSLVVGEKVCGQSSARFIYCAKASKKDRNDGCQGVMTWENVDLQSAQMAVQQLQKATSDISTLLRTDCEWSTTLSGNEQTARFLPAIKCIIEMVTKQTTHSATSNCSVPLNTNDFIRAATETMKACGGSPADFAEYTNPSKLNTTCEKTASAAAAVHAVFKMLCDANESAKVGNVHSTVKPTDLMRYLCRLVTPPGGVVLDPFLGSGSTGVAALAEGFRFIGIEREAEYMAIATARIRKAAEAQ